MPVQLTITGEDGLDAATQIRNFVVGLQLGNLNADQPGTEPVAKKEAAKPEAKAEAKPEPKAEKKAEEPVKKTAKKEEPADEEEEEAPKKTEKKSDKKSDKKADEKAPVGELVDDGGEQEPTVDGCRVMIRRVSRTQGLGMDAAKKVLAKFGVKGAGEVPEEKRQDFIDYCAKTIEEAELE